MKYILYTSIIFILILFIILNLEWITITPKGKVAYEAFKSFLSSTISFLADFMFDTYEKIRKII